jgi:AraC-like DNA-binding protein
MPGSFTSVFGEPEDFELALRPEGVVGLLITGQGPFRARLTGIALYRLRLAAGEEELARLAYVAVPPGMVLVALAGQAGPIWGGVEAGMDEIVTAGPGEPLHVRTLGASRWGTILVPQRDLVDNGRRLAGSGFVPLRGIAKWRPSSGAATELRELHRAAVRQAQTRSSALADGEAAHGLEQQLLHALINCLEAKTADREAPVAQRQREILARFEALLDAGYAGHLPEIGEALGVSERHLRDCSRAHLGTSPSHYRHRRAMQRVNRALRSADPTAASVSEIAATHGFRDFGRFAGRYRAIYGELPSVTLRRASRGAANLALHNLRRVKIS